MRKNYFFFKSLLLATVLMLGSANAWGAGYTRTLTDALEVSGYKAKAFYDFQHNDPEVLPTSGDLRYRDGGIWGLHNFGSGTRSGTATISVAKGDIIVLQEYSAGCVTGVSGGSKNSTLSTSTGYAVFDITTSADNITFTTPRYGGIVAAFVMEKDESAETADYSITYKYGVNDVKIVSGEGIAVGSIIPTEVSFFVDDVKYIRVGGEPESFEIEKGENNFTVNVRLAEIYNYSLNSNLGDELASGSGFEGETVVVGYPRYQLKETTRYEASTTNKEYRKTITLSEDNVSATVTYSPVVSFNPVVFYVEGENVVGMTASTANNIPVRASSAVAAVAGEDVTITTLAPGKYKLHVGIFTSKTGFPEKVVNFGVGAETFSAEFVGVNLNEIASDEYTLTEESEVKFLIDGTWSDAQFDYIWIERTDVIVVTISSAGFATLYTPNALDFTGTGLTAYTATVSVAEDEVTLKPVNDVKTETGVVLKGAEGTYNIPVIANSETDKGALIGSTTATAPDAFDGYDLYGLAVDGENVKFKKVVDSAIPAGKAFLKLTHTESEAKVLRAVVDGAATDVTAPEVVEAEEGEEVLVNLAGIPVGKGYKGVVINQWGVKRLQR